MRNDEIHARIKEETARRTLPVDVASALANVSKAMDALLAAQFALQQCDAYLKTVKP